MRQYPLARLLLPLLLGVATSEMFSALSVMEIITHVLFVVVVFILVIIFNSKIGYSKRWIRGACLIAIFYFSGLIYCNLYNQTQFTIPNWVKNDYHSYEVEIIDVPIVKKKTIKLITKIHKNSDTLAMDGSEKTMLYIQRDSLSEKINYGDRINVYCQFSEIAKPLNPYEFDYREFLYRKGIRYQSYVTSYAWEKVSDKNGNFIQRIAYSVRNYFLSILETQEIDIQEMGVVTAILLGYDENLDPELAKHYSGAGVSHILCVSGMHVGVIFLMLNYLFGFLDKRKGGKIIKSILLLVFVWFYAFLTGLSPSVLRAGTMFTFVIVGQLFDKHVAIYNSLLASLLFLIILDPFLIYSVGFQLSYLAVFSIVWLQKPIYNLYNPKNKGIDFVWQLASVSIAAQVLTTPLCLYYFHQFPNYFILANIMIPLLSSIVMYLGIAVISFSFIPFLSTILNHLLVWSVKFMNFVVVSIHQLPGSVTNNVDIDKTAMILLYAAFFFTTAYFLNKKKYVWWLSISLWLMFFGYIVMDKNSDYTNQKITFYSIRNQSLIEVKLGNSVVSIMDSSLFANPESASFYTSATQVRNRISSNFRLGFSDTLSYTDDKINITNDFLLVGNKSVLFIDKRMSSGRIAIPKVNVDVAYVRSNPWIDIKTLSESIKANIWVFDRTNSPRNLERMMEECKQLGLNFSDLSEDGAYELRIY